METGATTAEATAVETLARMVTTGAAAETAMAAQATVAATAVATAETTVSEALTVTAMPEGGSEGGWRVMAAMAMYAAATVALETTVENPMTRTQRRRRRRG